MLKTPYNRVRLLLSSVMSMAEKTSQIGHTPAVTAHFSYLSIFNIGVNRNQFSQII